MLGSSSIPSSSPQTTKTALFDPKKSIIGPCLTLFFTLSCTTLITYLGPTPLRLWPDPTSIITRTITKKPPSLQVLPLPLPPGQATGGIVWKILIFFWPVDKSLEGLAQDKQKVKGKRLKPIVSSKNLADKRLLLIQAAKLVQPRVFT